MKRAIWGVIVGILLGSLIAVLDSAASYPSSVKSFTTKNTGDAIQATHINDLQDEVTAIEGGLLNGLAHTVKPLTDATYDLGTTLLKWRDAYLSRNVTIGGTLDVTGVTTLANTGLHLLDTNASHDLIISPGSNITADRTLTITTGDADRTLTLSADVTLSGSPYAAGGTDVALADGGTGASLTDPNADRILFWDDSAGAVDWLTAGTGLSISGTTISVSSTGGTTMMFSGGSLTAADFSPGDGTTYYVGAFPTVPPSTTQGLAYVVVPKTGTVTYAWVTIRVAGTLGSSETFTVSLRLNDSSDTTISSSVQANANIQRFTNAGLSLSVSAGDRLECKFAFPTWVTTNPTQLHVQCGALIT